MANNFVHIQIGVTDLDKAKEFYSKIFDWKIYQLPGMTSMVIYEIRGDGDYVGGGLHLVETQPTTGTTILYINTEDIDKKLSTIEELGCKIILRKTQLPGGYGLVGRFEDPFGNMIGLWSEDPQAKK
ncbi:MAG: VOC family protein [Candidatus Heimdallarchaeota archaeon]|nr:VOC family protein [Candidatus Heimdallarchaeota archaeon]